MSKRHQEPNSLLTADRVREQNALVQTNGIYYNLIQRQSQTWWSKKPWAVSWQNQQNDLCAQQRLRSAWASAQFNQSLCCPPERLGPKLPTEHTGKTDQTGRMPRLIWVLLGAHAIWLVLSGGSSYWVWNHIAFHIQCNKMLSLDCLLTHREFFLKILINLRTSSKF